MLPAQLPFPLNVYALTLTLEYADARHLHFGVFDAEHGTSSLPQAQARAQDALCALLPPPPARILEVGCGTGALAQKLAASGFEVVALTPLQAEFSALQESGQEGLQFILGDLASCRFEQPFDIVLLQQSAQYVDAMDLFAQVATQLRDGGQLLLADEFLLDDSVRKPEPLPLLANFLRLAQRCGFSAQRQRELGRQVGEGLSLMAALIGKHRDTLSVQLGLAAAALQQLQQGLVAMQANYASARLGYTLLDLRYESSQVATVFGNIHSCAADAVPVLFERSFETPFDAAIWEWKYGQGRGRAVCVRQDGELIGHYGGAPREIRYFGEASKAIQICDVMVMPEHRSFVSRDTLFFKLAATFLEQQVGNCAEHLLGFGFPNMRVLKVARRLGLYDVTDEFIEIHYPLERADETQEAYRVAPFDLDAPAAAGLIDGLWARMEIDLRERIVGVRDGGYWQYRYRSHPAWERGLYSCHGVTSTANNAIVAVILLRQHEQGFLLMDIVAACQDMPVAIAALRDFLALQAQSLRCRITRAQADVLSLPGAQWQSLGIEIPCNIWTRGPGAEQLRGAWWLTAGDMDFL